MTSYVRDHLYVRKPALPRPAWSLPVQIWPTDCQACDGPIHVGATACPQCGAAVHVEPCALDVVPQFSTQ